MENKKAYRLFFGKSLRKFPLGSTKRIWEDFISNVLQKRSFQTMKMIQVPTYFLTYLFTPWCRDLLEKLTVLQLVKKFPAYYGIRRFSTAPTSVRHLSLSWASPIQSIYPHPTSWRSILILSTHLRLGSTKLHKITKVRRFLYTAAKTRNCDFFVILKTREMEF